MIAAMAGKKTTFSEPEIRKKKRPVAKLLPAETVLPTDGMTFV